MCTTAQQRGATGPSAVETNACNKRQGTAAEPALCFSITMLARSHPIEV
jgi:hypothetical protein